MIRSYGKSKPTIVARGVWCSDQLTPTLHAPTLNWGGFSSWRLVTETQREGWFLRSLSFNYQKWGERNSGTIDVNHTGHKEKIDLLYLSFTTINTSFVIKAASMLKNEMSCLQGIGKHSIFKFWYFKVFLIKPESKGKVKSHEAKINLESKKWQ